MSRTHLRSQWAGSIPSANALVAHAVLGTPSHPVDMLKLGKRHRLRIHACNCRVWRTDKTTWPERFRARTETFDGATAFPTPLGRALHVGISPKFVRTFFVGRLPRMWSQLAWCRCIGWLWCAAGRVWMVVLLPRLKGRAIERHACVESLGTSPPA